MAEKELKEYCERYYNKVTNLREELRKRTKDLSIAVSTITNLQEKLNKKDEENKVLKNLLSDKFMDNMSGLMDLFPFGKRIDELEKQLADYKKKVMKVIESFKWDFSDVGSTDNEKVWEKIDRLKERLNDG